MKNWGVMTKKKLSPALVALFVKSVINRFSYEVSQKSPTQDVDVDMNQIEGFDDVLAESDDLCKATKTFSCTSVDGNWKKGADYVVRAK